MRTEVSSQGRTARRYGVLLIAWSLLVIGSLLWNMHLATRNTLEAAAAAANANIDKDFAFRKWATSHGGVYVPPTEHTPPNPYLKLPDRDVVTSKGKHLTLMNPAYMLREMQADYSDEYGIKSHITSLELLNPKNAPDAWETEVLRAFDKGEKERMELQQIESRPYLRLMRPLMVEQGCLKCHGFQGYKVGEVRGGVSTSVYLGPYLAREHDLKITLTLTHGAIWLMGLAGLGFSWRRDRDLAAVRGRAQQQLRESEQKYHLVADYTADWEYWIGLKGEIVYMSPSCEAVTGHAVEEFVADPHLLTALVHPDDLSEYQAHTRAHSEQAAEGNVEFRILRKDGETHCISHHCQPVFDQQGNWRGIRVSNRDITERKQAEFVLRQSEETLKEAQRIAHLGSWHMDLATNEVYWSEELYKIYGFDPALPPPLYTESMKLFTPESWERLSAAIAGAIETGTSYELELETTAQVDGGSGWMLARGELVRDAQGAPVRVRGVVMNITARKHAEEKLRRSEQGLSEAQRMAHLGNWNLDLLTNVLTWSDEIFRIFEIDKERFGASYDAFLNAIHPDDRERVNNAYTESLRNKTPYEIVHRLLMRDGRIKYVNEKCETYYDADGKPLRSVGTVHDITAQKHAELEIKALNRDLEHRVEERTSQLEAANKELEAFSYSVSHDLRTPLRAIDGFSHILLDDYADKLDDEGKRLLNVVRDNTHRMGQLIDDILKFSRTGRIELTTTAIDMEQMAHAVVDELQSSGTGPKPKVEIEAIPPALGDSAMMQQVFVNLLSNAMKFSRYKENPQIRVGATVGDSETVYYVKDNGVGFDMQYADKLFGVFQRLHSINEFEGTGIGLAIVKRIITRHGGRVWAEGKVNEGATVYFALPNKENSHD